MMEREKKKAEISEKEKVMQQVGLVEAPARDCQLFFDDHVGPRSAKSKGIANIRGKTEGI